MIRDIPTLSVTILKDIAKNPSKFVTTEGFSRTKHINVRGFDLVQTLVNYVIEAGRLTDDVLPAAIFADRITLSLKNSKISPSYLHQILRQCPNLRELDLSGTFLVDDESISTVLQLCPFLTRLGLQNCRKLTNTALEHIASKATKLVALQLGGNFNITPEGLIQFLHGARASELREFHVSGLLLTGDVVIAIAKECPQLTRIGMNYCNATESSLRQLFDTLGAQLEVVSIAWMGTTQDRPEFQISAEFVSSYLPRTCPRLAELDVSGLRNVNASCLMSFFDSKSQQVEGVGNASPLRSLKAKYIGSSKSQLEQTICISHSYVKFTL